MVSIRLVNLYVATYFHYVVAVRVRINAYVWLEKLEPCDVMGITVYDILLSRGLRSVMERISDILNNNGEIISIYYGNDKTEIRVSNNQENIFIKVNVFGLVNTIRNVLGEVSVHVLRISLSIRR